jgi:hypothetical protein
LGECARIDCGFGDITYAFGFAGVGGVPIGAVPEPGTLALFGLAAVGLAALRRRRIA